MKLTSQKSPRIAAMLILCALSTQYAKADDNAISYQNQLAGISGIGVATLPNYIGSDTTKTEAQPLMKLTYGRFFAGGNAGLGFGYNAFELGNIVFGSYITHSLDDPREVSEDPAHLHGLGDVDATTRAAVFAAYRQGWMRAAADASWDIGGDREGMIAKLSVEAVFHPAARLEIAVGPHLLFGNTEYEQTLFGVNVTQSLQSGMPVYTPKSGLSQASVDLTASYALSKSWVAIARLSAGSLVKDSANSPIVEKKNQDTAGVYLAYKF